MKKNIDISHGIRNAREKLGLTKQQMADLLGVTKETISNYENNKTLPDIISICKLAYICECSADEIIGDEIQK